MQYGERNMKTNRQNLTLSPKPLPRRRPAASERLKPERVELRIETLPGWTRRAGGQAISRYYDLPDAAQALAFLDTVQSLGRAHGRLPQIELGADGALVTFPTPRSAWIDNADYELAVALGKES
jgi:pterin-4a-carbinolamine dehydratase